MTKGLYAAVAGSLSRTGNDAGNCDRLLTGDVVVDSGTGGGALIAVAATVVRARVQG